MFDLPDAERLCERPVEVAVACAAGADDHAGSDRQSRGELARVLVVEVGPEHPGALDRSAAAVAVASRRDADVGVGVLGEFEDLAGGGGWVREAGCQRCRIRWFSPGWR